MKESIRRARDLALERLLEQKGPDGSWPSGLDISAFLPAIYILMLRTAGLTERPGTLQLEAELVRHMITEVNQDGGFYAFPGSSSSRSLTRLAVTALDLVLGDRPPRRGHEESFRGNDALDDDLRKRVAAAVEAALRFLGRRGDSFSLADRVQPLPEGLLTAYAGGCRTPLLSILFEPEVVCRLYRSPFFSKILGQLNPLARLGVPALSTLCRKTRLRGRAFSPQAERLSKCKSPEMGQDWSILRLAEWIRSRQNKDGGWAYNAFNTILNVMALREAGLPQTSPCLERALSFLERCVFPAPGGGLFINHIKTDVWNTALAVGSYLKLPGRSAADADIRDSLEFLLAEQNERGGFAFGCGSENDPDNDSTALVLRILAIAVQTADGGLRQKTREALQRGRRYLLLNQRDDGGFGAFERNIWRPKRRPAGAPIHALFDFPTADLMARVLCALIEMGMTEKDEPVRKCLKRILRCQLRKGAWWSRWWAGYISGTDFVLDALGRIGLRWGRQPGKGDPLLVQAHRAMEKGMRFILGSQSADGGWGETILSDLSPNFAGRGPSRPLHTASALFDLLACGYPADAPEIERGYAHLLRTMTPDGRWEDDQVCFTVVPRAAYYAYPFMNLVLPLNALTAYLVAVEPREKPSSVSIR